MKFVVGQSEKQSALSLPFFGDREIGFKSSWEKYGGEYASHYITRRQMSIRSGPGLCG